jgi:hypothetical protein
MLPQVEAWGTELEAVFRLCLAAFKTVLQEITVSRLAAGPSWNPAMMESSSTPTTMNLSSLQSGQMSSLPELLGESDLFQD